MAETSPVLLLTRDKDQSRAFEQTLQKYISQNDAPSVRCVSFPLIKIDAVPFKSSGFKWADQSAEVQGVIFTSANAVRFFAEHSDSALYKTHPCFCVGAVTAKMAEDNGFTDIHATSDGTAEDIASLAEDTLGYSAQTFLYVRGVNVQRDMKRIMQASQSHTVHELVVYEATERSATSHDLSRAIIEKDVTMIAVFSARTAEILEQHISSCALQDKVSKIKLLSISTQVVKCLEKFKWQDVRIAQKPSRQAMLELVCETASSTVHTEQPLSRPAINKEKSIMSTQNTSSDNIDNANEIIERFGGIRPMAKKTGVAVTTIQGWKKRDSIPGARRARIIKAAEAYNVKLSDLIEGMSSSEAIPSKETPSNDRAAETKVEPVISATASDDIAETPSATKETEDRAEGYVERRNEDRRQGDRREVTGRRADDMQRQKELAARNAAKLAEMNRAQSTMTKKTSSVSLVLFAIIVLLAVIMFWPIKDKTEQNTRDIAVLTDQARLAEEKRSLYEAVVPQSIKDSVDELKTTAKDIQVQVKEIKQKTDDLRATTEILFDEQAGTLSERLTLMEAQLSSLSEGTGLGPLSEKISSLQQTLSGQQQLEAMVSQMLGMMQQQKTTETVETADGSTIVITEEASVSDVLAEAQVQEEGALADTLAGVPKTDLKAAAYLIALGKFRDTTRRSNTPLSEDLALIYRLVDEDDVELRAAIERLAPKAEQGVITPQGLSGEFKGLAGDIVVASLKGEDVSLQDRAQARLHDVLKVEKDGEMLTGTETQEIVSKAQAYLDAGDVEGALAELKQLEGDAAGAAAPFMDEAEKTIAAQQIQALLGDKLLSHFGGVEGIKESVGGALQGSSETQQAPTGASILPRGANLPANLKSILNHDMSGDLPADLGSALGGALGGRQPIRIPKGTTTQTPVSEPVPQQSTTDVAPTVETVE